MAGCVTQGYEEPRAPTLFDIIEPFADYAFNKSHSYGYGLVAYQTAWLKAHHPTEYMAALFDLGEGQQGQDGGVSRRMSEPGHRRPAPRRQPLRGRVRTPSSRRTVTVAAVPLRHGSGP